MLFHLLQKARVAVLSQREIAKAGKQPFQPSSRLCLRMNSQEPRDDLRGLVPALEFGLQLLPTGTRESVKTCPAIVF